MMPNLGETYKLLRELDELPQGRQFIAEDMRRQRHVSLLVFGHSFLSETAQIAAFERAVDRRIDVAGEIRNDRRARNGELQSFTGIDSPYEPPQAPDIHIDTTKMTAEEAADLIVDKLIP